MCSKHCSGDVRTYVQDLLCKHCSGDVHTYKIYCVIYIYVYASVDSSTNALTGEGLEEAFQWLAGKLIYCVHTYVLYTVYVTVGNSLWTVIAIFL